MHDARCTMHDARCTVVGACAGTVSAAAGGTQRRVLHPHVLPAHCRCTPSDVLSRTPRLVTRDSVVHSGAHSTSCTTGHAHRRLAVCARPAASSPCLLLLLFTSRSTQKPINDTISTRAAARDVEGGVGFSRRRPRLGLAARRAQRGLALTGQRLVLLSQSASLLSQCAERAGTGRRTRLCAMSRRGARTAASDDRAGSVAKIGYV